jgi:signal transduction histidine kinase
VRVLLIEDSLAAAEVVRRRLDASEFPDVYVGHVSTLEEAEPILDDGWNVVLLDLGLPGCDDLEALAWVRRKAPHLPIVVLTGHDDLALAMRALSAEAQDYLVKWRIDTDSLVRAIRYAIGRQSILARLAHAVEEARASEARLHQLTVRSADGILVVGPDARVVFANPAAQELLGRSEASLLGEPVPIDLEHEEATLVRGREEIVLDVRVAGVDWQGTPSRLALLRDVTSRRRSEELRVQLERSERLAAVGQLAAGVAHEINNPLTYVTVNLDLAKRELLALMQGGVDTSGILRRLAEAREGASRVVRIVRDLGMFARVEPDASPRPVDVNAAILSALNMAASHIKYRASVHKRLEEVPKVLAAEGRLSQVFLNLLVNAGQAIAEGHAADNRIEVRTFVEAGDTVVVEVSDTGHGIPEEHLHRLFEPFFTTKKVGEGSGLGLSICRSILETYGGSIEAESELGMGTRMRVRLPAHAGVEPKASDPAMDGASARAARRGRILLVDDEPAILRVLSELLTPEHEVVTAVSGEDARTLLAIDDGFDVVICDVVMDDGTGIDLYRRIESQHPRLAQRVIFMTGGVMTAEAKDFLADHGDRLVPKPVDTEALRRRIAEAVRRTATAG